MITTLTRRLKALEARQPKPELRPKAIFLLAAGVPDDERTGVGAIIVGGGTMHQWDGESYAAFRERVLLAVR